MALDPEELREKSPEELKKKESESRKKIWELRMQFSMGQHKDPHKLRRARRDLARVLTVQRERELAAAKSRDR